MGKRSAVEPPLKDPALLVAVYRRTNLTMRQLAPLFGGVHIVGGPTHRPPRADARAPAAQAVRQGHCAHRGRHPGPDARSQPSDIVEDFTRNAPSLLRAAQRACRHHGVRGCGCRNLDRQGLWCRARAMPLRAFCSQGHLRGVLKGAVRSPFRLGGPVERLAVLIDPALTFPQRARPSRPSPSRPWPPAAPRPPPRRTPVQRLQRPRLQR